MRRLQLAVFVFSIALMGCQQESKPLDSRNVSPSLVEMDLSQAPTHEQLSAAGQLGGVLTPTKSVEDTHRSFFNPFSSDSEDERLAFGKAIQSWNQHHYTLASTKFDQFRQAFPNSAWAGEATLHMACNARFTGQYATANQLFNEIIEQYSDSDYIGAQQMVAKAKSRLAVLRLMENNVEASKQIFSDVHQNAPDWRLRTYASTWLRKLSAQENNAGSLLDCGTRALAYLLEQDGQHEYAEKILGYIPANDAEGFSISELTALASEYGYYTNAVKATTHDLLQLTDPAILQISRVETGGKGHYWVLEKVVNNIFYLFDSQMNRRFELTSEQLAKEWQGNAILLSRESGIQIGSIMPEKEAQTTYGGCCGIQRPPGEPGDPERSPDESPDNPPPPYSPPPSCDARGAPIWKVNMVNMNLYMTDIPLWYDNAIGPNIKVQLSYNTQGVLAQNEPFGNKWMFNYGSYLVVDPGDAVTIFGSDGSESVFIKDNNGNYQSDRHFSTTLTINSSKQYVLTYANGYQRIYGVPEGTKALQNFLLQESDSAGNTLKFGYNSQARMTHIIDALGRKTTLNYNAQGLIDVVSDPFGRTASFEYDEQRNLIALTDMQGYRASLTYDENKLVTSLTDAKGTTQFYIEPSDGIRNGSDAYNPPGTPMWENYRITVTLPTGDKQEYYYDGYHKKAWYVSADHYQTYSASIDNSSNQVPKTVYEFVTPNGRKGEIAKVTYPDGRFIQYSYYSNNKLKSQQDQWGQITQYEWNNKGQIVKVTNPLGLETLYTYADNGIDLLSVKNANGETRYQYDNHHNITRIADIDGSHSTLNYDSHQNLISITDVNGTVTEYLRNANGLIHTVKTGDTLVNAYTHDNIGRLSSIKDINGYQYHFQYNNLDTLTQVTDPAGRTTTRVFGDCPRLLDKEVLPGDRTYQYEYDKYKRLTKIINPMKGRIELQRSASGNITTLTDQNSNKTQFEYTSTGQMSKKTYSDGQSLSYRYDKGRIKQVTNARGIVKTYRYNDKQQLSNISYSDSTPSVSYQYNHLGQLVTVTDQWGITSYSYDNHGRLKALDGPLDNDTVSLTYNKLGAIESLSVSGKPNTAYTYDVLGRVATITALGQRFSYQYDHTALSPSVLLTYPNGITQRATYGKNSDLAQLQYRLGENRLADYQYQFDEAGQLAKQTGSSAWALPENNMVARYNDLNQIIEWNGNQATFVYDKDGNPTQGVLKDNIPFTAKYDAENRLTELMFTHNDVQYKEVFGYAYNHMLMQYQLYQDNVLVNTRRFVRLGLIELQQRNAQNEVEQEYSWNLYAPGGIGGLLTTKVANQHYYYLYSHIGSVQKVVNAQGQMVAEYKYTPYGEVQGSDFVQQPFGYSTKRSDFTSGLVYFGYRFYTPHLKRWLNRDPLQEQGGINLYAYVSGDPLGYVDPDGRIAIPAVPAAIAVPVAGYIVCRALGGCEVPDKPNKSNACSNNPSSEEGELEDCNDARKHCYDVCDKAGTDFNQPHVWNGSYENCMIANMSGRAR